MSEFYSQEETSALRRWYDLVGQLDAACAKAEEILRELVAVRSERDVLMEKLVEVMRERNELRDMLIASVPADLVGNAELGCPSCGDTLTSRVGAELKAKADAATVKLDEVTAERDRAVTLLRRASPFLPPTRPVDGPNVNVVARDVDAFLEERKS